MLRKKWGIVALSSGLVTMFGSQLRIFYNPKNLPVDAYLVLMVIGLCLFWIGAKGVSSLDSNDVSSPGQLRIGAIQLHPGWLMMSLGLSMFTAWRSTLKPPQAYFGEHLLVWILSMLALVMAIRTENNSHQEANADPLHRRDYLLLLALLAAGLLMHIVGLNSTPYLLDQDEAIFAMDGVHVRQVNFLVSPFEPGSQSHPYLYQAAIGLSTGMFGQTLAAARLPSAILGALGIPALYLLGRELLGWPGGLISALFMLTWPLHVHFSRLTLNQTADPLFATLSFYFLLRALRGKPGNYVLSGIFMGIAQLFYLGGRLVPLVMVGYLCFLWLRQRPLITRQWRQLLLVPLAAFIVTLPQNYYLLSFHLPLTTRAWPSVLLNNGQSDLNIPSGDIPWKGLGDQLSKSFLALFTTPDFIGWYGSSSNLMGPLGGPLLLIGVLLSLVVVWKYPQLSLPLGWALVVILGGSTFSLYPPQYQRYFPGVSAFSLLVGMGVIAIATGITNLLKRPQMRQDLGLSLGILLCTANLVFYVNIFVPERKYLANRPNQVTNRVAQEMLTAYDQGQQIILIGSPDLAAAENTGTAVLTAGVTDSLVVKYLMADRHYTVIKSAFTENWLAAVDRSKPFTFIVTLNYGEAFLKFWEQQLPGGEPLLTKLQEDDTPAFYMYRSTTGIKTGHDQ